MKKFIYMVASLAFLTACHSTTTENKIESTQATATTEQTTVTTQKVMEKPIYHRHSNGR